MYFRDFPEKVSQTRCVELTSFVVKNRVLWDVTPCGSCKNRRFGGT
jgi:hypothetical protein